LRSPPVPPLFTCPSPVAVLGLFAGGDPVKSMTPSSSSSMIWKSSSPCPSVFCRLAGGWSIARVGEDGGVLRLKKVCRETLGGGSAPTMEKVFSSLFLALPCFWGHRSTPPSCVGPNELAEIECDQSTSARRMGTSRVEVDATGHYSIGRKMTRHAYSSIEHQTVASGSRIRSQPTHAGHRYRIWADVPASVLRQSP
jgi:hypothetical protein